MSPTGDKIRRAFSLGMSSSSRRSEKEANSQYTLQSVYQLTESQRAALEIAEENAAASEEEIDVMRAVSLHKRNIVRAGNNIGTKTAHEPESSADSSINDAFSGLQATIIVCQTRHHEIIDNAMLSPFPQRLRRKVGCRE
mmetsp:Transcript_24308/g.27998  ORF Transcript_24308/g.27998 Transcript_24308/m.27998 type:complete len:140 (+) Transcript_24308:81-500(+)